MMKVTFIQPNTGKASIYVNPIDLQRAAGFLARESVDVDINIIDFNLPDISRDAASERVICSDVIILSTPIGSVKFIKEFLAVFGNGCKGVIFIGETITYGDSCDYIDSFNGSEFFSCAFPGKDFNGIYSMCLNLAAGDIEKIKSTEGFLPICANGGIFKPHAAAYSDGGVVEPYFADSDYMRISEGVMAILLDGLTYGCEHRCIYCHLNIDKLNRGAVIEVGYDPTSVIRRISSVNEDIYIQFTDENFFGGRGAYEQILRFEKISALANKLLDMNFNGMIGVDTRYDTVVNSHDSKEIAIRRKECWEKIIWSGLRYVYLGVESFADSQRDRYGKHSVQDDILSSIRSLQEFNVDYTVGLILLDPLVSINEITKNISVIKEMNLYGNSASLIKQMRVYRNSPYLTLLKSVRQNISDASSDFVLVDKSNITFQNAEMQKLANVTDVIHDIFSSNGYRHSDMAAIIARGGGLVPDLRRVPSLVCQMEIEILENIIDNICRNPEFLICGVIEISKKYVYSVLDIIKSVRLRTNSVSGAAVEMVIQYYEKTFSAIYRELESYSSD